MTITFEQLKAQLQADINLTPSKKMDWLKRQKFASTDELNSPSWRHTKEHELWFAVLQITIDDIRHILGTNNPKMGRPRKLSGQMHPRYSQYMREYVSKEKSKDRQDSWEWFHDDGDQAYGFRWVCEVLGLDPAYVRKQVVGELDKLKAVG